MSKDWQKDKQMRMKISIRKVLLQVLTTKISLKYFQNTNDLFRQAFTKFILTNKYIQYHIFF